SQRSVVGLPRQVTLVENAERARRDAVAAAVTDVLLHDDGAELGSEERAGRAGVEAPGVRAVLADVRLHEPAQGLRFQRHLVERSLVAVEAQRLLLLDECDVPPRVGAEGRGVVVAFARPFQAVVGHEVPLLAGDLACLAPDADGRVREEAHPGRLGYDRAQVFFVSSGSGRGASARAENARRRRSSMNATSFGPCGRRPGRMSHVNALTSWMWTFGSSAMCERSFAAQPVVSPR